MVVQQSNTYPMVDFIERYEKLQYLHNSKLSFEVNIYLDP